MPEDSKPPVIEANAEVLPPELPGASGGKPPRFESARSEDVKNKSEAARIVATWMDELIRIPGTNFRIGLDPILGLFPGVGDFLASSIGIVTLTEGVRARVPLTVLFRMGFNILINDAVGTIPGIGDLFSAWFKSNSRNLKLINQWKSGDQATIRRGGRIFLTIFLVFWISLLLVWLFLWFMMARAIYQFTTAFLG